MTRRQLLASGFLGFAAVGVATWLLIRPAALHDAPGGETPRPRPTAGTTPGPETGPSARPGGGAPDPTQRLGKLHYVRLVDADTGTPVAWASVAAGSAEDLGLARPATGVTRRFVPPSAAGESDRSGLAVLYQRHGLARLGLAWSEEYAPIVFALSASATTLEDVPSLPITRGARLSVLVEDGESAPQSGVLVTVHVDGGRLVHPAGSYFDLPRLGWTASTDPGGLCRLEGLPAGVPLEVRLEGGPGRALDLPEPLLLTPGEARSVTWVLGSGVVVTGRLLRGGGQPVPGRSLWLVPAYEQGDALLRRDQRAEHTALTDANGVFRFEGVPHGDWWVGPAPSAPGDGAADGLASLARFVRIGPEERAVELLLMAHDQRWIEGRALDDHGAPVDLRVTAVFLDGAGSVEGRTDAAGLFRIGPLPPGRFHLLADGDAGYCPPVLTRAGDRDVRLELRRAATLQLRVVDGSTGAPVPAALSLVSDGPGGTFRQSSFPGGTELHVEEGLPSGRYTLLARTTDGRAGLLEDVVLDPDRGAAPVVVTVRPGARVRIRYRGEADFLQYAAYRDGRRMCVGVVARAESQVEVLPPGEFRFELLEAGSGVAVLRGISARLGGESELIHPPK